MVGLDDLERTKLSYLVTYKKSDFRTDFLMLNFLQTKARELTILKTGSLVRQVVTREHLP
jgi:hypothetical protein